MTSESNPKIYCSMISEVEAGYTTEMKNGSNLIKVRFFFIFILFLFSTFCTTQKEADNLLIISGNTMGTSYTIKIVKNNFLLLGDHIKKVKNISEGIEKVLENINMKMSTYIPESEISTFNRSKTTSWIDISPDLADVLLTSIHVSKISEGAFDITIGPLVNLWGFGPYRKSAKVPERSEIDMMKERTGYYKLSVRKEPPAVKKDDPDIYCDLSAVAKGYGVDMVSSFLDSHGFYNYLVEIGGEISVRGRNAAGENWRLGVLAPDGSNSIEKIISIGDLAMATSGDYHNYFEEGGVRYSHTIDPETGYPITHKLVSVTVVRSSCMEADALATAIDVMGPSKGYNFALKNSIPVYMIIKEGKGYRNRMSPAFEQFPIDIRKDK